MSDISHVGTVITMQASVTFADAPVPITYNPDDTDPFDAANITIGDAALGTNGHVISWSTASIVEFTIGVVANSPDHIALSTLLNANTVAPGKTPNRDIITFTRVMPDGSTLQIKNARITGGTPFLSMASSGRIKTPTFTFKCPPSVEILIPQL